MANIFVETITYLTDTELKDSTKETGLQGALASDIENRAILIRKSEITIDSIIVSYGTKLVTTQKTIFPTVNDGTPVNIKKATVLLCDEMYKGGELTSGSSNSKGSKIVKSEKYGNHQVTYQDEAVVGNTLQKKNKYITQEIEILLRPYINVVGSKWSKSVV